MFDAYWRQVGLAGGLRYLGFWEYGVFAQIAVRREGRAEIGRGAKSGAHVAEPLVALLRCAVLEAGRDRQYLERESVISRPGSGGEEIRSC